MSTPFNWFARLLDTDANGVPDVEVAMQVFDIASNAWATVSTATTSPTGLLRGKGTVDPNGRVIAVSAPAMRLIEVAGRQPTVLSASPRITVNARPVALMVDFGELTRLKANAFFVPPRASLPSVADDPFIIGAVASPTLATLPSAELDAKLDDLRKEVTTRLTQDFTTKLQVSDDARVKSEQLTADTVRELKTAETTIVQLRADVAAARDVSAAGPTAASVGPGSVGAGTSGLGAVDAGVLLPGSRIVGMGAFATNIGGQLDGAQLALKPTGFSIGNISLTTRALVQGDGSTINLLDKDELKAMPAGSLSDLKLDFTPDRVTTAEAQLLVPDVVQLTESAARRVLGSLGYVLDASAGPPSLNPNCAEGQAMLQSPVGGAPAARGARVLVIFSRSDS